MPIRINLLAEAQELEELRRRDPVKRAMWVGAMLVVGMLAWSLWLQGRSLLAKNELNRLESRISSHSKEYESVLENQKKLREVNQKLGGLQQLATNRFLHGNVLNAFQQATLDEVQLTRLKTDVAYILTEEAKPKTNANRVTPGKPAFVTERITLTIEAKDAKSGDSVNTYREMLANSPYFKEVLSRTNEFRLTLLGTPTPQTRTVPFSVECRFPEKTR
jgi:Tfp pilus assembly protein PilN